MPVPDGSAPGAGEWDDAGMTTGPAPAMPPADVLLRAVQALGKLVTSEFGDSYSLAGVAETFGLGDPFIEDFTKADVEAIRAVEEYLAAAEV